MLEDNMYPTDRISLRELSLRDGLQMTKTYPSTDDKIKLIQMMYEAGVTHFEVGSFLQVKMFPQFADIRTLIAFVADLPNAYTTALTLNERAMDDALETPLDEMVIALSATEEHCQANIKRSRDSAVGLIRTAVEKRKASSWNPIIASAISVSFGCSISGDVDPDDVLELAMKCAEAGADQIAIADTVGFAGPKQVHELSKMVVSHLGDLPIVVHLHDTRGTGIANAYAALDAGVRVLDGTLGGLGGCPFAPGATGNVSFEDLVYLCERSGFRTGIDLEKLIEARNFLPTILPGEQLYGTISKAGTPTQISWQST